MNPEVIEFIAYIDESGDEGFGKLGVPNGGRGQSTWLMLGAIIVSKQNDALVPTWKRNIRDMFPEKKKPDLHWKELKHEQKVATATEIEKLHVGVVIAVSHKVTIPGSRFEGLFKQPNHLYNYLVRWLVERLITASERAAAARGGVPRLKLVFSRRASTDYESMKDYFRKLQSGRDVIKSPRSTNWDVLDIDGIEVENHSKRAGLQLADCVTSAFANGLEPNRFGQYETRYGYILLPKLLRSKGTSNNLGFTVVPNINFAKCDDEQLKFIRNLWIGQAPGS